VTRLLAVETSCDETSAAVLEERGGSANVLSLVILSQDVHRVFGGVVPEIASRAHLTSIAPVVRQAIAESGLEQRELDAVAVTNGPGLVGALLVGLSFAKALAFALRIPVIGVHHMEGHLFATSLEHEDAVPPFTALLISGGHTLLIDVESWGRYRLLGRTRDDAAGEAFDKVAKLLGLPYPGGAELERLANASEAGEHRFSRPMLHGGQTPANPDYLDFSFSGLKTAALNAVRKAEREGGLEQQRGAIARAFQDSIVETLVEKTFRAVQAFDRRKVVLGGGVSANETLVAALRERVVRGGGEVFAPSRRLATDNAAMIGRAGLFHFDRGVRAPLDLNAYASMPLPGLLER
jgi:N6-L-threonylcarbamoyladenine synthase